MIEYTVKVSKSRRQWFLNNKLHSEHGPAVEILSGNKAGSKYWYINGNRHRLDGPAIESSNGYEGWYKNGLKHRVGGPATTWADGTKVWAFEGKLHREDGPAVEWANGKKEWWVHGVQLSEWSFNNSYRIIYKNKQSKDFLNGLTISSNGKVFKLVEIEND